MINASGDEWLRQGQELFYSVCNEWLIRFCRVPYGLASAPSAFQKMMHLILQELPNVANYLDVIIWGHTAEEHEHSLKAVLQCLQDSGLKMYASKYNFSQTSLQFLVHTVTAQGVKSDKQQMP